MLGPPPPAATGGCVVERWGGGGVRWVEALSLSGVAAGWRRAPARWASACIGVKDDDPGSKAFLRTWPPGWLNGAQP